MKIFTKKKKSSDLLNEILDNFYYWLLIPIAVCFLDFIIIESTLISYRPFTKYILLSLIISGLIICISIHNYYKNKHRLENIVNDLKKNEEQMRTILNCSPDLIVQVNKEMKVIWANKASLDLVPTAIGKPCYEEPLTYDQYQREQKESLRNNKAPIPNDKYE